jgi:hypothetical protein
MRSSVMAMASVHRLREPEAVSLLVSPCLTDVMSTSESGDSVDSGERKGLATANLASSGGNGTSMWQIMRRSRPV